MGYKLLIFDLDGTVLNTLDDLTNSINYALTANGFPERTKDEIRTFVGNGIRKLTERAVGKNAAPSVIDSVYNDFCGHYREHSVDKTVPYKGIIEALNKFKKDGCLLAVVSNKADFSVKSLCEHYFNGLFDYAVGEREGICRKPCPDSVNETLSKLGVNKEDAVYIGDSEVDVRTAENAGIDCISVSWGFKDRNFLAENGAKVIVDDMASLMRAVYGQAFKKAREMMV